MLLASLVPASPALAEPRALIVTGLAGSPTDAEELQRLAVETGRLLVERGIPAHGVRLLTDSVKRDDILAALREDAARLTPTDEYWLVLYGHSGRAPGGGLAFQVRGPRLTAADLKTAIDALPCRQSILIGTNGSGTYLAPLTDKRRFVLSATQGESEMDQPRFPAAWVKAFAENPRASFAAIAARASALVEDEYRSSSLAQTEHARMADPVTGHILGPPFGIEPAAAEPAIGTGSGPLISASDIEIKARDPQAHWHHLPATDETRRLIDQARAVPNPSGHSAIIMEQRQSYTVEPDRTTEISMLRRIYVAREEAAETWGTIFLPASPPSVTTRLQMARVIRADGSRVEFNPERMEDIADPVTGERSGCGMVYLPGIGAGCVIETSWRTRTLLDATLPHVSERLILQERAPVLKMHVEVRAPQKRSFRVALNNLQSPGTETVEAGRRIWRWDIDNLPAAEPLPNDPPPALWVASVSISSLPSWEEFAQWYRRLAEGSDKIDDTVRETAAELAAAGGSRLEKIQRMFEFVAAMRYIAIEIGVQGFRPRTPAQVLARRYGDCKDKANLLAALLRSMDVDAHFVLVNRGSFTDTSFPSWQFNHAICKVPADSNAGQPQDLWLDATDTVTPFGVVAPGDFGRQGLVFFADEAAFEKVGGESAGPSIVRDLWQLTQSADGAWSGELRRETTGLAEDTLRRTLRGASPLQRSFFIHQMAADLWPGATFADPRVGDVSRLDQDPAIVTRVTTGGEGLPRAVFPWAASFALPERDRPLWLNDGQPFHLEQTVRVQLAKAAPAALPDPHATEASCGSMRIEWRRVDDRTLERIATFQIVQPLIDPAEYAAARNLVAGWNRALREPVPFQ